MSTDQHGTLREWWPQINKLEMNKCTEMTTNHAFSFAYVIISLLGTKTNYIDVGL